MTVRRAGYFWIATLTGMAVCPFSTPVHADDLRLELGKCAAIAAIQARLACYDSLARAQLIEPVSSRTPSARTTVEPAAAKTGSSGNPKAKLVPDEKSDAPFLDKVTLLKELRPDKWQITLANDQVWQQTVGKAFLIRVGDIVSIARSGWGRSYRLAIDGHPGFIQVERVH